MRSSKIYIFLIGIIQCFFLFGLPLNGHCARDTFKETEKILNRELKKRTKYTGTWDTYDAHADKVRNLKLIEWAKLETDGNGKTQRQGKFRDIASGEILYVNAFFERVEEDKLALGEFEILSQKEEFAQPYIEKKEYTDQEILDFMKNYLSKRAKFSGTFDIYDEKSNQLKELALGDFRPGVRRFGIFAIASIETIDQQSKDEVVLDVTVENKDGRLRVKKVRFKNR